MAAWIKMPLDTEEGLGPGDFVLDGDPAPPFQKGGRAPNFRLICYNNNNNPICNAPGASVTEVLISIPL